MNYGRTDQTKHGWSKIHILLQQNARTDRMVSFFGIARWQMCDSFGFLVSLLHYKTSCCGPGFCAHEKVSRWMSGIPTIDGATGQNRCGQHAKGKDKGLGCGSWPTNKPTSVQGSQTRQNYWSWTIWPGSDCPAQYHWRGLCTQGGCITQDEYLILAPRIGSSCLFKLIGAVIWDFCKLSGLLELLSDSSRKLPGKAPKQSAGILHLCV